MRLIDANALLKQIGFDSVKIGPGQYGDEWRFMGTIVNAPTIDPVRHGKWIDSSNGWMCTCCGMDTSKEYNYCPNCGAKMDGGE